MPVGEDQKQHLELSRDIAQKFNNDYGQSMTRTAKAKLLPAAGAVHPGTRRRASCSCAMAPRKCRSRMHPISPHQSHRRCRRDRAEDQPRDNRSRSAAERKKGLDSRPEVDNLVGIYAAITENSEAEVLGQFGGGQFSTFKAALVDLAVAKLGPINSEMKKLVARRALYDSVLADGSARAQVIAAETMKAVKDIVGFVRR